jgi:outer membrane protein OmpA-like peptidoglycan-associated protein
MKKYIFFLYLFFSWSGMSSQTKSIFYFDSNKYELKKGTILQLDSIVSFLRTKDFRITIKGYCDNSGDETNNQILSEKRAIAVSNYFKNKNIPTQLISSNGFSSSEPIADNKLKEGRTMNRRVEISITINNPIIIEKPIDQEVKQVPKKVVSTDGISEKKESFNSESSIDDLAVGKTLVLKNLNFEGGTAILLSEAKPTLELLLKILKENPSLEIEVGGHVCCADDMPLSVLRAKSVCKYLVKNGIDESRLTPKGYSRNNPIYEDDRAAAAAKANRRVEITILKK